MEDGLSFWKWRIPHEGVVTFLSLPQKSNQNRWKILHRLEGKFLWKILFDVSKTLQHCER